MNNNSNSSINPQNPINPQNNPVVLDGVQSFAPTPPNSFNNSIPTPTPNNFNINPQPSGVNFNGQNNNSAPSFNSNNFPNPQPNFNSTVPAPQFNANTNNFSSPQFNNPPTSNIHSAQPNISQNPQIPQQTFPQNQINSQNPQNFSQNSVNKPQNIGQNTVNPTSGNKFGINSQGAYVNNGGQNLPNNAQWQNNNFSQKTQNPQIPQQTFPQNPVNNPQNIGQKPKGGSIFSNFQQSNRGANNLPNQNSNTQEDLRKSVIQTQIEIEKSLIENQKHYLQGVNTVKDLIAPSAVRINASRLEIGTKFIRTHFVLTYPRVISSGWLESVINADIPLDLSIFIYPQDSEKVLNELRKKVGKINASLELNSQGNKPRDPALEIAYQDVEQLRDAIMQGVEKFFRVGVYITIYADNEEQLERYSKTIENFFARQNIITKRAAIQMDSGFNSTLPMLNDELNVFTNLNTSPLSASFPFVSSDLSSDDGILYGINRHNTSLVIFDRFELENANSTIFATSGAGKSYTVKLEILRHLMLGTSVLVIDPENEYKLLSDTVGGTFINLSLNSNNRINPFDLPKPLPGEDNADVLRSAIIDLLGLISLMVGTMTPEEVSIMERAIKETYAKYDITENGDFEGKVIPTLGDLVNILGGIVGGENLAQRLYRYTEGTFSGFLNQRTNININNNFIVFNLRDLQNDLRPIAMYTLLKFVWNEVRSEKKKRILAVDEAWIMMQHEDSARFLFGLVKRARKYYLGVTTITQDVGDFLRSPFGKPIVTNSAMKILLKQDPASIENIKEVFNLTEGEAQVLLQSGVGQGIFFAGPRHVAIEILAFPTEHKVITTNPKELEKESQQETVQGL